MAYNETCCQLCAVPFNIGRLRTKHEPEAAGWRSDGSTRHSGLENEARCSLLKEESGCENLPIGGVGAGGPRQMLHLPG